MPEAKWPGWVEELKNNYLAGSSSFFILHGNVDDVIGSTDGEEYRVDTVSDFLARRLFGRYELVMHYDMGRGLRPHPGADAARLAEMNRLLDRLVGGVSDLGPEPNKVFRTLDRMITLSLVGSSASKPRKTAFIFDYADYICPPGDRYAQYLATFLNWARSPVVKRVNMIFVLLAGSLGRLHPALVQSGFTTEIRVPMPTLEERVLFITKRFPDLGGDADRLGKLSAGLTLSNLENLLRLVRKLNTSTQAAPEPVPAPEEREIAEGETPTPTFMKNLVETRSQEAEAAQAEAPVEVTPEPDRKSDRFLVQIKKQLIEAQVPGLLEFIEPNLHLDFVAGHVAAKKRLANDAKLIQRGNLEAVPMGYLICGPVGVGKTFIAMCYAGTVGIPCVKLRNFRSKYVGETESNLEKILGVLRELGPVAVIIDEADAAVGNRGASGDSGTSARVFASLASQMGDTRYRGKIIWFLLTCRPDLLPIDLKRQGRCEEHIPLFYPETEKDLQDMFMAMNKKMKLGLTESVLPDLSETKALSGADIEGILTRVRRVAAIAEKPIDKEMIEAAMENFHSTRTGEHELQWIAGILECSDLTYLPESVRKVAETEGGFLALGKRLRELSQQID